MAATKTKIAGTAVTGEAAIDVDGTSVADFAKKSADGAGMSEADWFKKFTAGVNKFGKANGISSLASANVTDAASMQATLDTATADGGYDQTTWPMMQSIAKSQAPAGKAHFFYDTGWQYTSSADWPKKWTTEDPVTDAQKAKLSAKQQAAKISNGSWLVKDGQTFQKTPHVEHHYVDPLTTPFIARHDAPMGSIYKVWNPGKPSLSPVYAMVLDHSPAKYEDSRVEVSPAVQDPLGIVGTPNGADGNLSAQYLGNPGMPDHPPTFDEIQAMGRKLDPKAAPVKPAAPAAPAAPAGGGAVKLMTGENSVVLGQKQLPAAFADPSSVHSAGGHMVEGSSTVMVGPTQAPFSRVTDHSNDGYAITTGENTVLVGG